MVSAPLTAALAGIAMSTALASPGFAQVEYDSAGVTVVENAPAADSTLGWTVGPHPRVEIGGAVDDARYQLFRVVDAARMSDGRIVVANAGAHELRFYAGDGAYVSSVGGEGGGPGEFRLISALELGRNDSIYVFDGELQRLSIFDARGEFARTFRVPSSIAPIAYVGRFTDERWYARDRDRMQLGPPGAIRRDTIRFIRFDSVFENHSVITALPGMMTATFRAAGDLGYRTAPFSPSPEHDVLANCLYIVTGDDFDVLIFSSNGRLVRVVRNGGERKAVSEEHRTAWIDDVLGQVPEAARPQARRAVEHIPTPEELPVYNDVVVDASGYMWLQEYIPQSGSSRWWAGSGRWWIVLSPTGKLLGRVEMPVALDIFDIGPDYVLGLWRDEIGEEFVRMYQLRGPRDPRLRHPVQCAAAPGA